MRNRSKIALSIIAIVIGLILGVFWMAQSGDYGDSRRPPVSVTSLAGTSLYIDDNTCADCHAAQASGLKKTGHADTFRKSIESNIARGLEGRTFQDPERGYEYRYHFDERDGLSVSILKQFGEDRFPLPYELGSGHNAVTYLTLIPNRVGETVGIEHRVSLYPGVTGWDLDLTPGHKGSTPKQVVEHLGEAVQGDKLMKCVACHTTSAEITRQEIVNLRPNVGCQNCHGPGREHVIALEQGRTGNYAGFTQQSAFAEIQLCGRCHRLPNADVDVKVEPDNIHIVRFQSVGLLQSECFKRGGETLKCSTCHDPHQPVSRESNHYVQRCLNCHSKPDVTHCPVSPQTGCIECHMPPIDVHRGIKFHDHWIRVRADRKAGVVQEPAEGSRK